MVFTVPSKQSHAAPDLAKMLGLEGIRYLLEIMCDAYFDLLKSGFVHEDTLENCITEEWFVKIQIRYQKASHISVIPFHQKSDPTKGKKGKLSPTIDFCFRDQYFPQSYFGTECKLMDEGNNVHLREYLKENGVGRFLDGRYASNSSVGAMVGYVKVGNPKIVANEVARLLSCLSDKPKMMKVKPIKSFEDIYDSHHKRSYGISPFQIFHLFYEFNCEHRGSSDE